MLFHLRPADARSSAASPPLAPPLQPVRSPRLGMRDVGFSYGQREVLRGVSVEFHPGQVTAVIGANGSGKSTLIEIAAGVLRPQRGSVTRHGELALVVQRASAPPTLPITAGDAVEMGLWARRTTGARRPRGASDDAASTGRSASRRARRKAVVLAALDRVDMAEHATRSLHELSGGQRQRVLLAQGIVRQPEIVLLDEPTTGFDRESRGLIRQILADESARGAIVVCVTHDPVIIDGADRVVRVGDGSVDAASGLSADETHEAGDDRDDDDHEAEPQQELHRFDEDAK